MGQKVHPNGIRVGVIKDWNSKWYADSKNFADYLVEDHKIREYVKKKLFISGISKIEIERTAKFVKVNVYTAKPGLVIGKGGNLSEALKAELEKMIKKDHKKIPASKVDYGNKYLIFLKGENMWNKYLGVSIYHPFGPKKFQSHMIEAFAREDSTQEIAFRRYYNESKGVIQNKLDGQNYKVIYELPKEYEWMIEWMNKEYEDGRYKRVY